MHEVHHGAKTLLISATSQFSSHPMATVREPAAPARAMEARDQNRIFETVQAIGGFEWMKKIGSVVQTNSSSLSSMQEQMEGRRKRIYKCGKRAWTAKVRYTTLCLPDCDLECLEDIVRFLRHDTPVLKPVRYVHPFDCSACLSVALIASLLRLMLCIAARSSHSGRLYSSTSCLYLVGKPTSRRYSSRQRRSAPSLDPILITMVLQVLVMLTMPDVAEAETRAQLIEAHQAYKEAFLKQVPTLRSNLLRLHFDAPHRTT